MEIIFMEIENIIVIESKYFSERIKLNWKLFIFNMLIIVKVVMFGFMMKYDEIFIDIFLYCKDYYI